MIQLHDIMKRFCLGGSPVDALCGITLRIDRGDYVAVSGRSGSGKSTLLNVIGCIERPSGGEYFLDGRPVSALDDAALSALRARTFGFVFQAFHLLPEATALENVRLPMQYGSLARAEWSDRARRLLDNVGLGERAHHRPSELSGGEQQRVAIARALANDPTVLLADEPTGNLDSKSREHVMRLLEAQVELGLTLVLVTHDSTLAGRAKTRVALLDGRVVNL